ncbi:MAG: hypothetical protein DHS20C02_04870 [Micavibrio sp.]|nr:MAG: hypothetical protein DHS20C02_04870 [Micavibrio sp.]
MGKAINDYYKGGFAEKLEEFAEKTLEEYRSCEGTLKIWGEVAVIGKLPEPLPILRDFIKYTFLNTLEVLHGDPQSLKISFSYDLREIVQRGITFENSKKVLLPEHARQLESLFQHAKNIGVFQEILDAADRGEAHGARFLKEAMQELEGLQNGPEIP